nr:uncharacterized protein LOC122269910 [Parasteatoda tepidariorum]
MLRSLAAQKYAAIGETTILPSSFPESTRWYTENFEHSMALVRRFGSPEFFITVTCNPQWPELLSAIRNEFNAVIPESLLALTRPDMVARVARLKFRQIVEDIMTHQIFGRASTYVFTIEFQKRGLPHMHLLVIMSPADKIHSAEQLDDLISAEIPEDDLELKELISKWMIHNPRGDMNPSAPCMVSKHGRDQCRWGFPMEHQDMTSLVDDEKPRYRRRYNPLLDPMNPEFSHEQAIYRKDCNGQRVTTDNHHVVPYNAYLLKKYQCHINVEFVGSIEPVEYLYKYIYKGHDCATIKAVENQQTIIYNKPEKYVEARYISPVEACWRLFKDFEIQAKSHTVVRLDIHLPGQDGVNLDQTPVDLANIGQKGSTLRAYFRHNTALKEDEANGKAVTYHYYHEMPEHYRWIGQTSTWQKNVNACSRIGRVYPVNFVSQPELFFLCTLLFHVKEPTNFRDLYIVDGVQHATYKQACLARGLTYDDQQYVEGLRESASSKMPSVMRILFAQILILGAPENPKRLWELFKEDLAEDFIREARRTGGSIEEAIKRAYRIIAHKLNTEATEGRNFRYWVQTHGMEDIDNYEQDLEHDMIDVDESTAIGDRMYQQLNEKQREIVDTIIQALEDPTPAAKCFFIDGPGGTGKTFVYSTLYRIVTGRLKKYEERVSN